MFGDLQQRNVLVTDTPTIQRYLKAVDTDVLSVKTKVAQVRSTANSNNRAENSTDLGEFEFLVTAPTA